MPGLLTHLARTVGSSQIENVASAALRYLLVTHPAAGSAMTAYLRELTGGDLPDLGYASQSGEPGAGIVDITATDHNGTEHVVVEAKVEAGFQPDQIATYLTRVEPVGGYVVVLAPQRRLAHLRAHALAQAATAGPDGQDRTARVALTTWEQVLSVLQSAVGGDPDARFELDQITELYRDLERLQRIPLDSRHVSDETARTVATMFAVVDELLDAVNARRDPDVRLDRNRRGGT